jgi:hypothetical protein
MLRLFNKEYKSISNLFVRTIEEEDFVYPFPLSLEATMENESQNTKNEIEIRFGSYFDSILTLDYRFQLTFFLLTPYYNIEVVSFSELVKLEDMLDTYGYKGKFGFQDGDISMNLLDTDIYPGYKKFEKTLREKDDKTN